MAPAAPGSQVAVLTQHGESQRGRGRDRVSPQASPGTEPPPEGPPPNAIARQLGLQQVASERTCSAVRVTNVETAQREMRGSLFRSRAVLSYMFLVCNITKVNSLSGDHPPWPPRRGLGLRLPSAAVPGGIINNPPFYSQKCPGLGRKLYGRPSDPLISKTYL